MYRASRDLGCRTLGELLDMDVPRTVNMNCNRLCPTLMPGAVTGKRFGLTCLCCPIYGEETSFLHFPVLVKCRAGLYARS